MAAVTPIKVLMPIFSGFNTLDLNGPLEVLARPKEKGTFKCTIAAAEDVTLAAEGVSIQVRRCPLVVLFLRPKFCSRIPRCVDT